LNVRHRSPVRIIGGLAAGRRLAVPAGFDVRPMPEKVKGAVFNSLGMRVDGASVLDLFAGTGALGLEALSRGALRLTSIEKSSRHARYYRDNLEQSGLATDPVRLRIQDVFVALPQLAAAGETFDLVIADPPYGDKNVQRRSTSLAQRLLDDPTLPTLVTADGLLVLGHTRRDTLDLPLTWEWVHELSHGDTRVRMLRPARPMPAP
jgi:16S rRNA (guanine966-N2)-methyltransferase